MDTSELATSLPAWAILAIIVTKMVLDWMAKRDEGKRSHDGAAAVRADKPPTSEEIAALIRDQDERREMLEHLREQGATSSRIAESIEHVSQAMERMARTQDTQTQLIERQAQRSRVLAESQANSRQILDRIQSDLVGLQEDIDEVRSAIQIDPSRRATTATGTKPPPTSPRGEGT